jgi:hypothetical protein
MEQLFPIYRQAHILHILRNIKVRNWIINGGCKKRKYLWCGNWPSVCKLGKHENEAYKVLQILNEKHVHPFSPHIHLFSIPEIHKSGYRTCHYITIGTVQNES